VLIDGRTVYTPGFSGVYWDQQAVPLENIERIEVIRGPGGTVCGANAVNGVINIITRSAEDTRGGLISAETGSQDRAQGLVQYGGAAGAKGSYRVYGRYAMNANSPSLDGGQSVDAGHNSQLGFRSDWTISRQDKLSIQGQVFGASESQTISTVLLDRLPDPQIFDDKVRVGAGNILGRWNHVFSNGAEATAQVYYDRFRRFDQALNVENTGDVDLQYHFHAGSRNDIVTGIGYRVTDQSYINGYQVSFGSGWRRDNLFNSFVQDEISLTNSLALTIGVKFEHNAYSGYEYEPSVQLTWSPASRQTVWASASKAIEQPSWFYAESQLSAAIVPIPGVGAGIVQLNGSRRGSAPRVFNYELGYRAELSKRVSLDTSIFLGDYHRQETAEPGTPYFASSPGVPHLVLPNSYANLGNAKNYGIEVSGHWNAARWWRISPGFSFLQMDMSQDPRSQDNQFPLTPGDSPKHQAQLRSSIKLPRNVDWDTSAYYTGSLSATSLSPGPVAAYTRVDTRFGWRIGESVEVSVAGQNLLTPRHLEFMGGLQVLPMQAGRNMLAKITWSF
jgi:iron complex outermembrane recepter protein